MHRISSILSIHQFCKNQLIWSQNVHKQRSNPEGLIVGMKRTNMFEIQFHLNNYFLKKCTFIPYLNWGVLMLKIRSKRSSGIAIIIHGYVMARWHRMAKITWLEARTCRCFRPAWIPTWVVDMVVKGWQIHLMMPVHKAVHEWPVVRLVQWWISGCYQPRWFHW